MVGPGSPHSEPGAASVGSERRSPGGRPWDRPRTPLWIRPSGPRPECVQGVPGALIVGTIAILVVLVSLALPGSCARCEPRRRAFPSGSSRSGSSRPSGRRGWRSAAPDDLHEVIRLDARLDHRFPDARSVDAPGGPRRPPPPRLPLRPGHVVVDGQRLPAWWLARGLRASGDLAYARTGDGRSTPMVTRVSGGRHGALMDADLADEGWRRSFPRPGPASRAAPRRASDPEAGGDVREAALLQPFAIDRNPAGAVPVQRPPGAGRTVGPLAGPPLLQLGQGRRAGIPASSQ